MVALTGLLADPDAHVRISAAWGVGDIGAAGDERFMVALAGILADQDRRVRHAAFSAITRIGAPAVGDERVAATLARLLADPDADVRRSAADAVAGIGAAAAADEAGGPSVEEGDFIDQTIAIWQKRSERSLIREDGREIIENITGFFTILQEWERKERTAGYAKRAISAPDSQVGRRTKRTKDEAETGLSSKPVKAGT